MAIDHPKSVGRFKLEEPTSATEGQQRYRATDTELQRSITLVLLDTSERPRDEIVEQATRVASVQHPSALEVYDIGDFDQYVYVAMEHVIGVPLPQWLTQSNSWQDVLRVFAASSRALAALLDAGASQAEFEPAQIIIDGQGQVRLGATMVQTAVEPGDEDPPSVSFLYALDEALRRFETQTPRRMPDAVRAALQLLQGSHKLDLLGIADELDSVVGRLDEDLDRGVLLSRMQRLFTDEAQPLPLWLRERPEALAGDRPQASPDLPHRASSEDLPEVLQEFASRLVLLGEPGSGKTTALRRLAEQLVLGARSDPTQAAPILLRLASWSADAEPFRDWVENEVVAQYSLPKRALRPWIDRGQVIVLLDGLDEVAPRYRDLCARAINAWAREVPVRTVVSCRDDEYFETSTKLAFDLAVSLEPLDDIAVEGAVEELTAGHADLQRAVLDDTEIRNHLRSPSVLASLANVVAEERLSEQPVRDALYDDLVLATIRRREAARAEPNEHLIDSLAWLASATLRADIEEFRVEPLPLALLPKMSQRIAASALGMGLAVAIAVVASALVTAIAGELASSSSGVASWIALATVLAVTWAARSTALQLAIRATLAVSTPISWSLRPVVDNAVALGFMRCHDGRYRFGHDGLRRGLARRARP